MAEDEPPRNRRADEVGKAETPELNGGGRVGEKQGRRHSPVMLPVWVLTDRPAPSLSRFCICPASFIQA